MIESSNPLPQRPIDQQSDSLRELYRRLAEDEAAREANAELMQLSEEEARFAASQWTMIWRRFRRNRAAIIGMVIVLFYYLVAAFGNFIAPYH